MTDFVNSCYHLRAVAVIAFGLGAVLFAASAWAAPSTFNFDKSQSYECGFEPFEDARSRFDVRFYLVALLFIIFDLEVAFLFPLVGHFTPVAGGGVVLFFLAVLTAGFVYEWEAGALQWS